MQIVKIERGDINNVLAKTLLPMSRYTEQGEEDHGNRCLILYHSSTEIQARALSFSATRPTPSAIIAE
jgi:hypothetical protein